jgi:hypothetical protein
MSFVVNGNFLRSGEGSFQAETFTRKAAIETAIGLVGQGMDGVTITDETGRVFKTAEFAAFFRAAS